MIKLIFTVSIVLLFHSLSMSKPLLDPSQSVVVQRGVSSTNSLTEIQSTMVHQLEQVIGANVQALLTVNAAEATRCRQDSDCEIYATPHGCGLGARNSVNKEFKFLPYLKEISLAFQTMVNSSSMLYKVDNQFMGTMCPALAMLPVDPKCESRRCVAKPRDQF